MNESRRLSLLRIRRMVVKEARQLLRDPMSQRMMFGAPIIMLLLFGYAVNTDVRDVSTFLVDHDRTAASLTLPHQQLFFSVETHCQYRALSTMKT